MYLMKLPTTYRCGILRDYLRLMCDFLFRAVFSENSESAFVHTSSYNYLNSAYGMMGARSSLVVEALCYKSEGRGFEIR
jgi:hypothetical protein